ncbi:MAG: hypothetical protein M3174_08415 [Actinomycetota bacterium]|nr:hypothetical protein [Actinomycetota bacterium]
MAPSLRTPATRVLLTLVVIGQVACQGSTSRPSEVGPTGPPDVRTEVIADHAQQLDEELADRPAGSQLEQAASQYVLGHLQLAGYFVQLDAVPVANLVESTNLVALPPSGEEPETVVAVAYDAQETDEGGEAVGVFLELARALYAAHPDHRVEFVALGAENTAEHLGSRRLAQQLRDEERSPRVVTLVAVPSDEVGVSGQLADEFETAAEDAGVSLGEPPPSAAFGGVDVFERAGFESAVVGGGTPADLGALLVAFLAPDGK